MQSTEGNSVRDRLHAVVKAYAYRPTSEATDAILSEFSVTQAGVVTDDEMVELRSAVGQQFHGLSYRERLIVRAAVDYVTKARS